MRRLLLALLLVATARVAQPVSLIAHTAKGGAGTTSAINTTGATLIVVYAAYDGASNSLTLSDSASNTWTALTDHGSGQFPQNGQLFYKVNPTTSSTHTFTFSGSAAVIGVEAFSGVNAIASDTGGGTGGNTALQPGTVSTPGALLVTGLGYGTGPATINSSFTITDFIAFQGGSNYALSMAYLVTTSAVNPTWSSSTSQAMASSIAAFSAPNTTPAIQLIITE